MLERFRARRQVAALKGKEPPCVGCREPIDQLDPIEPLQAVPSSPDSVIGPVPGLWEVVIDDQLVVLDRSTGRRVLLNASAALIFTAVDRQRPLAGLVDQLAGETGTPVGTLTADVTVTVDRLLAQGMLNRDDLEPQRSAVVDPPVREPAAMAASENAMSYSWAYDSGPLALFGTTAAVRATASLTGNLADLLAPVPRAEAATAAHHVDVVPAETDDSGGDPETQVLDDGDNPTPVQDEAGVQVVVDRGVVTRNCRPDEAAMVVLDHLDRLGVRYGRGLRFHAGAAERDGRVVIVLGQSGDGKSTLTAALVQAGYAYLTDELAAVDPATLAVLPYARPLDLDATSRASLGVDGADTALPNDDSGRVKAKVASTHFGPVSAGGEAALIVLLAGPLSDRDDPPAAVTPLPPAEALMALLPVTFADSFDDERALADLAHLCTATRTVRLARGPLVDMVAAVDTELDRATTRAG